MALGRLAGEAAAFRTRIIRVLTTVIGKCVDLIGTESIDDAMLAAVWALAQYPGQDLKIPLRAAGAFPEDRVRAYVKQVRAALDEENG